MWAPRTSEPTFEKIEMEETRKTEKEKDRDRDIMYYSMYSVCLIQLYKYFAHVSQCCICRFPFMVMSCVDWPRVATCSWLSCIFISGGWSCSLRIKPPTIIFVTSPFYILISKLKEIAQASDLVAAYNKLSACVRACYNRSTEPRASPHSSTLCNNSGTYL